MDTLAGVDFVPTEFVDITDEIELKLRMLECHESQVVWMRDHDHIDFPDMVRTCSKYRGYQCGATYAEGFRQCNAYLKKTRLPPSRTSMIRSLIKSCYSTSRRKTGYGKTSDNSVSIIDEYYLQVDNNTELRISDIFYF